MPMMRRRTMPSKPEPKEKISRVPTCMHAHCAMPRLANEHQRRAKTPSTCHQNPAIQKQEPKETLLD